MTQRETGQSPDKWARELSSRIVGLGDFEIIMDDRYRPHRYFSDWRRQGVRWGVYAKDARWKRRERRRACIESATKAAKAWGKAIEKLGDEMADLGVSLEGLVYTGLWRWKRQVVKSGLGRKGVDDVPKCREPQMHRRGGR